ncbi:unnamed protein product [Prorocentrum cordatum]|uniref:Protein transport protein SEC23 n=1 Tax=Prorocentrum cordatum TaxID=2364126 RepID=A0ABN9U3N8_9DINO|nr:unnamed protein product [Polarella glacialis]
MPRFPVALPCSSSDRIPLETAESLRGPSNKTSDPSITPPAAPCRSEGAGSCSTTEQGRLLGAVPPASKKPGLAVLPNCHAEQTFAVEVRKASDELGGAGPGSGTPPLISSVQCVLKYRGAAGELRVRVHTWSAAFGDPPLDEEAAAVLLSGLALGDLRRGRPVAEVRAELEGRCRQGGAPGAPERLARYVSGMLWSDAFRVDAGQHSRADLFAHARSRLEALPVPLVVAFYSPRLVAALDAAACATGDEGGAPVQVAPGRRVPSDDGLCLLEDGRSILLWVGPAVDPAKARWLQGLSGAVEGWAGWPPEAQADPTLKAWSERLPGLVAKARAECGLPFARVRVVPQHESADPRPDSAFTQWVELAVLPAPVAPSKPDSSHLTRSTIPFLSALFVACSGEGEENYSGWDP